MDHRVEQEQLVGLGQQVELELLVIQVKLVAQVELVQQVLLVELVLLALLV